MADSLQSSGDFVFVDKNDAWMSRLPETLHNTPINRLAIPGSHNSFAFHLRKDAEVGPDVKHTAFGKMAGGVLRAPVKKIMHNWSITQTLTFEQQLKAGIRYFDFRLGNRGDRSALPELANIYLVHGLYGATLKEALTEIKTFLDDPAYKKEVLILHIQHMYNFNKHHHKLCQKTLHEHFQEKLCPKLENTNELTLRYLWENGHQVICIYGHKVKERFAHVLWPKDVIHNPWFNAASPDKLIEKLEEFREEDESPHFRVFQGILTPNTSMIAKHPMGKLRDHCGRKASRPVVKWLKKVRATSGPQHALNICIVDFVEEEDFIPSVIAVNFD